MRDPNLKSARRIQIVSLRMVREQASILFPQRKISKLADAAELFRQFIGDCDREVFCIMTLDTKNQPTALHQVSCGTLSASLVHPRETYKLAILSNAASIIGCHNHPSGDPTPSPEDVELTERIRDAGSLLGIELLDHIVLGEGSFISLKERGFM